MVDNIAILDPAVALATDEGWNEQEKQWNSILRQGVLPKSTDTPAKCIAISKLGAERFGWGPMDSVTKMCIVEGNIELRASTMMGLMQARAVEEGGYVMLAERSEKRGAVEVQRKGWPRPFVFEFTREDAEAAGLWGKVSKRGSALPWKSYAKDMLVNRAISRASRWAFSDVTGGAYAMGEITGFDEGPTKVQQLDRHDEASLAAVLDELPRGYFDPAVAEEHAAPEPDEDPKPLRRKLGEMKHELASARGYSIRDAALAIMEAAGYEDKTAGPSADDYRDMIGAAARLLGT